MSEETKTEDLKEEINETSESTQETEETLENEASTEEPTPEEEISEESPLDALNNKYLRLYAEFENFRRRTAKENLEVIESANAKLLGSLAEVAENFDRAFAGDSAEASMEDFKKGIELIHDQFNNVLTQYGLTAINPVGEVFDPNLHEALMQQPSEEVPENHVLTVFQKGFKVKNKVIKHAKVIVSAGPQ